jgi:uncharacterized protein YceH (UPF0502 family)
MAADETLRAERDYWRSRYETQHRTVHAMEDEIETLRREVAELRERLASHIEGAPYD